MSRRKKIVIWVMGVMGALLVLLLIFILLLPRLINLEPIREKILATISQKVEGQVVYQTLDLSFFPRPRAVIHQGSLSIPGKIAGTLEYLAVYPEILPLLKGKVRIAMLHVEAPDVKMELPGRPEKKEEKPKAFSFATIQEEVTPVLAFMALEAPGLVIRVEKGRLNLSEANKSVFWFGDIEARIGLPPEGLEIDLTCKSNLWEGISLEGWLNAEDFKGNGRIDLTHFQPQGLTDYLFPLATGRFGDSQVNLKLSFEMDGIKALQGEVRGSIPYLTLQQAKGKLVIRGKSLKGAFHMDEDRVMVSLTELDLDYPQLTMSGTFRMDQTSPRVSLELEGREVDVHSTREAALALVGEVPDIQEIFDIVRGGKVPLITVNAQGSSLADLGKTENILIKGSIAEGKILVLGKELGLEGFDLDLDDVKGEVVISGCILEGKNLEARLGNSWGRKGRLKLGLKEDDYTFHLDIPVQADLTELPPIMKRLVDDKSFLEEISLIKDLKGSAKGRLVLGESTKSINARVEVSEFNLFGRYGRIPYPLEIRTGQLSYDGDKIGVKNLTGTLGKSSFSELTAQLNFDKAPYLEVLSGKSSILLGEIYPWLSSLEGLNDALKDLKSVQGAIALSLLDLKGPLSRPQKWRFQITGEVENLAVDSTFIQGPLKVSKGTFKAVPEKISLTDARIGILDASLRVSAFLNDYLEGLQKADFTLQGSIGPEAIQWISNLIDVPPKLRIRAPLSISRAHVGWNRNRKTSFAADLAVKDGPGVSIDMLVNPEELTIEKLLIQDKESRASLALTLRERELHLDFRGDLGKTTLDGLLVRNQILTGRIQGDIQAHILLDHPMRSTAQGKLQGVGLGHPLELKVPLTIENVSLEAKKNKLTVESALVTWGERHLSLEGNVDISEEEFLFDMNLSADGFEWEKIEEILEERDQEGDLHKREDLEFPPLRGTLGVKLGYFKYGRFTWRPFHAAVSFDHGGIELTVTEANVCGISTPGVLKATPQDLSLDFKPVSIGQEPGSVLACLLDTDVDMTGNFDFKGEIMGRAKPEELVQSLKGNFELVANKGRIYRSMLLLKIFGLINVTEIFRGKFPDLGKEGFAYDSFIVKANLQEGKLILKEAILDGSSMELVGQGEVDLMAEKMDLTVLVAPLKTVDFVVKKIPLVRQILSGTLVAIPVRVRGDLANPKVRPLSPSAVGSELSGIMKRIFRLPIKVIQPLRDLVRRESRVLSKKKQRGQNRGFG